MTFHKDDVQLKNINDNINDNIIETLTTNIKIDCLKDQVNALKFLIGGLIEYVTEHTDFWDYHDDKCQIIDFVIDWANKLETGLKGDYLPPYSACTCPREWSENQMQFVNKLLHEYWKNVCDKTGDNLIQLDLGDNND